MLVGVDIGGTFTDFVSIDDASRLSIAKRFSTPHDPAQAMLAGLRELGEIGHVVHGSTVATNAILNKAEARRVAIMAQDGYARAIRPAHTPFDGDTVFALSIGAGPTVGPERLLRLGCAAADCLARAIMRGVQAAEPLGGLPSWRGATARRG